jgi:hypothetical protein
VFFPVTVPLDDFLLKDATWWIKPVLGRNVEIRERFCLLNDKRTVHVDIPSWFSFFCCPFSSSKGKITYISG